MKDYLSYTFDDAQTYIANGPFQLVKFCVHGGFPGAVVEIDNRDGSLGHFNPKILQHKFDLASLYLLIDTMKSDDQEAVRQYLETVAIALERFSLCFDKDGHDSCETNPVEIKNFDDDQGALDTLTLHFAFALLPLLETSKIKRGLGEKSYAYQKKTSDHEFTSAGTPSAFHRSTRSKRHMTPEGVDLEPAFLKPSKPARSSQNI